MSNTNINHLDTAHPDATDALARIASSRAANERLLSRERAMDAINHREPDRVPIDLWASSEVKEDLVDASGYDYDTLLNLLGVDFRVVRGPSYVGLEMRSYPDGTFSDLWGVRRKLVTYGKDEKKGTYKEVVGSPLSIMDQVEEIDAYSGWPSPDWWDYSHIAEQCRQYDGMCVVFAGDRLDRTAQLKTAMYLRGAEQIMIDLALSPQLVDAILAHITNYYLQYNERVFQAAEGAIDIFMMGDDFGIQTGPMMSVKMWERFFEPGFRAYIQLAHKYGIKVMHHTCGAVEVLIPKFIDAGLDILQSIQPRAIGMDLSKLKDKYGKDLVFHGSIDIQNTMPYGTPQDVRNEVKQRMEAGKHDGGFIICTAHDLQRDVPIENIFTLFDAYHELGPY